jgi:hypothetical protein
MNWGSITVVIGLLGLAFATMPFGIVILVGLAWVYSKS